jgi:predicted membrane protein (TIGR00267 family)
VLSERLGEGLLNALRGFLKDLRNVTRYADDVKPVARRMFVTNAFDGLLAALGVSMGGYSDAANPKTLALGIVGGGLAMGLFSGMIGVYLSERAERMGELRHLESKMMKKLEGTIYWRIARVIPVYVALWSGLGVTTAPIIVALPYILVAIGMGSNLRVALLASILSGLGLAALLGYYLGHVSGESKLVSTLRFMLLAAGGVLLVYIIRRIVGIPV